jgi:hypothetical protein
MQLIHIKMSASNVDVKGKKIKERVGLWRMEITGDSAVVKWKVRNSD